MVQRFFFLVQGFIFFLYTFLKNLCSKKITHFLQEHAQKSKNSSTTFYTILLKEIFLLIFYF